MATVSKGRVFVSGETVTPTKLNELVDLATVTSIVDADVSASAAIALSKLATGALPTAITVASANLVDGTIVNADINATAAIAGSKLADAGITAAKLDGIPKDNNGSNLSVGAMPAFACRAWVSFDGNSSVTVGAETRCTIRASANVSKVVRNGTGDYTVFFTTEMTDTNYVVLATHGNGSTAGAFSFNAPFGTPTTSGVRVACTTVAVPPVLTNALYINVAVFR